MNETLTSSLEREIGEDESMRKLDQLRKKSPFTYPQWYDLKNINVSI